MGNVTQNIENINDEALKEMMKSARREYYRLYRRVNKDRFLEREAKWREKNYEHLKAYRTEYQRKKRCNNPPSIPWRSIEKDGLPKLEEAEVLPDEDGEISRFESDPCLVYMNVDEEYLEYDIAMYIKCEYKDGVIEGDWYDFAMGTVIDNVTHWSKLPKPPTEVTK